MYNENEFENNNLENEQGRENMENTEQIVEGEIIFEGAVAPKPPKKKGRKAVKIISASLAFVLVAGACFQGADRISDKIFTKIEQVQKDAAQKKAQKEEEETSNSSGEISAVNTSNTESKVISDVSSVVDSVMPSIVSITCVSTENINMFGRNYSNQSTGSGSGIIIGQNSSEVLIVTNNHVVEGAEAVKITFNDNSTVNANVKGTDSSADLAVVSVPMKELTDETKSKIKIATLGDSTQVKTGSLAIAIGNALGYGQSVTVGYISALDRQISTEDASMTLIQTDAAINPGNSGGALLNANGQVIGINSAKFADTNIEGMGYAIPISKAVPIINDLMNRETIPESEQAFLGINGKNITEEYTQNFNIPVGVLIIRIGEDSPAQKAGLQAGDVITEVDGKKITTMEELSSILSGYRSGKEIVIKAQVNVNNRYQEKKFKVTLGSKADSQEQKISPQSASQQ